MQRFLQLPGAAGRAGGRGACGADQEAASPVLGPEGGPPPWYQALQPEELRWLQAPEEDTAPEAPPEGPCPEPGQSQSQPLRYRGLLGTLSRHWEGRGGQPLLLAQALPRPSSSGGGPPWDLGS